MHVDAVVGRGLANPRYRSTVTNGHPTRGETIGGHWGEEAAALFVYTRLSSGRISATAAIASSIGSQDSRRTVSLIYGTVFRIWIGRLDPVN